MKDIGLDKRELDLFYSLFRKFSSIEKVILFGSRAKGTFKANSDIDLAVSGIDADLEIESLAMALDELPLPYKIDVKSLKTIQSSELRDHISRVGLVIFP